ncbi:thiamine transport system permease protein [Gordonia malaquae]|uniref:Putative ABC transporter permease protein n=1 Tax=Gordonia malaquae NBRC 108250 TaxID=1223542 RepID=M3UVU3_GORML|nr:iron ABC transporter permease [Gordonia malaquae]GAC79692.1 putative ABC transporter permease protein [Gordonia malaquae NBRC 108250]SED81175.1 thiamine transport system permease protein [Gordonia malaquae]
MARHREALTPVRSTRNGIALGLISLVPLVFATAVFLWPLGVLVARAFDDSDGATLPELWDRTHAWRLLAVTVGQAAGSALTALIVAAPIVWLLSTVRLPGSGLLRAVVTVPFVLPTVVVGVAFRALFDGPLAFLDIGQGWTAIIVAHTFLNVAVVVRVVSAAWQRIEPREVAAARTLGASAARAFLDVVIPRLLPAIASAFALVLLFCSTSFGVIQILGGGDASTLETEIYLQGIGYAKLPDAVALSMLQIVLVLAALGVARVVGSTRVPPTGAGAHLRPPHGAKRIAVAAVLAWIGLWLILPIVTLVIRSLRPGGHWGLAGYRALADTTYGPSAYSSLGYSVSSGLLAAAIAVVVGLLTATALTRTGGVVAKLAGGLSVLPLGVSAVTLGFGYVLALATVPYEIAASPLVVPCVQALIAIPVVVGVMVPALEQVPDRLRDAAAVLGAGPLRVFVTVDLRLTARSLAAAAGFAFVMAVGEFGATTFLARADTTTLPVLIGSLMGRPGADNFAAAMAASVVLVAVSAAVVAVVETVSSAPETRAPGRNAPKKKGSARADAA